MVVRAIIVVLIIHSHVKKKDHTPKFWIVFKAEMARWGITGRGGGMGWSGLGSGHMSKSQPFFSHNDFVVVAKRRPNKTARKKMSTSPPSPYTYTLVCSKKMDLLFRTNDLLVQLFYITKYF